MGKNKGYFTGLSASMIISFPGCASYWGGYEFTKRFLTSNFSEVTFLFKAKLYHK